MSRIWPTLKRALMIPPSLVTALWEKSDGNAYRSTVLRPLGWITTICIGGAVSSASLKTSPGWLVALFGIGAALSILIYLGAYIYCLKNNPDYLRTERYSIQKLAIERAFRGDSLTGPLYSESSQSGLIQTHETAKGENQQS